VKCARFGPDTLLTARGEFPTFATLEKEIIQREIDRIGRP
jgi:hypothetical protein